MSHRLSSLAILISIVMCAGCGGTHRTVTIVQTISTPKSSTTSSSIASSTTISASTTTSTSSPAALAGRTVVVDPGHNGGNADHREIVGQLVDAGRGRMKPCNTTGTSTDSGYPESSFNLAVGLDLRRLLRAADARVVMTRTTNIGVGPCVNLRAAVGNQVRADAVIAIHADGAAPTGRGFQVIYPPPDGDTAPIYDSSLALAQSVHNALLASQLLPESTYLGHAGYDERGDLAGLNLSTRPAIFVELGNMRNATDASLQQSAGFRHAIAKTLYRGLARFLGKPR
jgi:N-acetylmuramoyl-L-alanine amidase